MAKVKTELNATVSGICQWRYFEVENKTCIKKINLIRRKQVRKFIWQAM